MAQKRRTFDPKFKAQVALEALKERQTLNELAARYQLTPQTISLWKQQLLEQAPNSSATGAARVKIPNL